MTLQECYQEFGGDYQKVMARLIKEDRVVKFLKMFLSEESMGALGRSIAERDYKKAFEYAHTLKGMALNLSLDSLYEAVSTLCEDLRSGEPAGDPDEMMNSVTERYEKIQSTVGQLDA